MNIKYAIPSYKRADGLLTLNYIKKPKVYVSHNDYGEYIKRNGQYKDNIVMVPDGVQGKGKGHAMNWLLDHLWDEETDAVVFLDDDISCLMAHNKNGTDYKIDEQLFYTMMEDFCVLAKDWGCGMFSFSLNQDRFAYDEFAPFRTHAYIDGACQAFVKNDGLRYDEDMIIKEDVDMFLQQLQKYKKVLRVNKYYLRKKSFSGDGGCQAFRSSEEEKKEFKMMQKKWGSDIIRPNKPTGKQGSDIRGLGGAIRLNIPLEGI